MSVKTATGTMSFRYDDQTAITGSATDRAGLATTKGSQVTVQYRTDGTQNMATMIDIQPRSEQSSGR